MSEVSGSGRPTLERGIAHYVHTITDALAGLPNPVSAQERRHRFDLYCAIHRQPVPPEVMVRDGFFCFPGREVPYRAYRPALAVPAGTRWPTVLYFHGGGWVAGSIATHEAVAWGLALGTGAQVISLHYRRPPENPYPAAALDCYEALCRLMVDAFHYEVDPERVVLAGDSAGGNLAAACTLLARDRNGPQVRLQALIYPVLDTNLDSASYLADADPFLSREKMIYYLNAYLGGRLDTTDPYAVPMRSPDLRGLPAAYVLCAEHDPLRAEGMSYAQRLEASAVPVSVRLVAGAIHGFLRARFVSELAQSEFDLLCGALRRALRAE